ncbi:hypothetical protein PGRAT_06360 [Paenibacillus graminis]|jgi:hypothetical protein|uniref:Uncharacterized protein n=1 Tax=Paenibacillus graminis TaxID=189425 RepID=A0A089M277_9BACL|nr:hypothetical protein PGRAT_06360 [Paenibacillus graminis]
MPLQYINELLELPEQQLHNVLSINTTEVHLEASPVAYKQPCPICYFGQSVIEMAAIRRPRFVMTPKNNIGVSFLLTDCKPGTGLIAAVSRVIADVTKLVF